MSLEVKQEVDIGREYRLKYVQEDLMSLDVCYDVTSFATETLESSIVEDSVPDVFDYGVEPPSNVWMGSGGESGGGGASGEWDGPSPPMNFPSGYTIPWRPGGGSSGGGGASGTWEAPEDLILVEGKLRFPVTEWGPFYPRVRLRYAPRRVCKQIALAMLTAEGYALQESGSVYVMGKKSWTETLYLGNWHSNASSYQIPSEGLTLYCDWYMGSMGYVGFDLMGLHPSVCMAYARLNPPSSPEELEPHTWDIAGHYSECITGDWRDGFIGNRGEAFPAWEGFEAYQYFRRRNSYPDCADETYIRADFVTFVMPWFAGLIATGKIDLNSGENFRTLSIGSVPHNEYWYIYHSGDCPGVAGSIPILLGGGILLPGGLSSIRLPFGLF